MPFKLKKVFHAKVNHIAFINLPVFGTEQKNNYFSQNVSIKSATEPESDFITSGALIAPSL